MKGLFEWYYGLGFVTKMTIGAIMVMTGYMLAVTFYGSIWGFAKSLGLTGMILLGFCLCFLPFKDSILSGWNAAWDFMAAEAMKNIHRINEAKKEAKKEAQKAS